ncbi:thioredoxin-like protein HCF164, chloroplastic [Typha latifolia]|uniref:thioredoxin-like protein HCF164, chloroplastic n=1 Tax=Typha latifolia TaxID=4733 RepID=UPI003C2CE058
MARVASTHLALLPELCSRLDSRDISLRSRASFPIQKRTHGFRSLTRRAKLDPVGAPIDPSPTEEQAGQPDSVKDKDPPPSISQNGGFVEFPNKDINRRVALASTVAAVGLFLSKRLEFGISLKDLTANAVPYEEALSNGMPTVLEFYADWCEVCRELAPDIYKVEQEYKGRVNFVMLNVDNTKWEQELDEFGVEGIPHFAFLDKDGNEEGNVVGRLPKQYFLENIAALANGETTIPHARVVGQYSSAEVRKVHQVVDPRSHG